ncbi:MAG: RimK-like ATPgrasp N-terminal domain-containing protein [Candidatus Zixiibacteriota bacterium]
MKEHKAFFDTARRHLYTAWCDDAGCLVNLAGDYDYLESAYYVSQDLEDLGREVHPTCKEALDAYVPPLFLEKSRLHGLLTPEFYISNGYFEPPVIIDPINPFMSKSRVVLKPGREKSIAKSMTRNFTYAICCQELPADSEVKYFRSVLGWCASSRYRDLSRQIWEVFRIPLARVRVVQLADGKMFLSDISPFPFDKLGAREIKYLQERIRWDA